MALCGRYGLRVVVRRAGAVGPAAILVDGLDAGPMTAATLGCCPALRRPGELLTRGDVCHVHADRARDLTVRRGYSAARPSWFGSMRSGPRSTAWRGRCRAPRAAGYVAAPASLGNHGSRGRAGPRTEPVTLYQLVILITSWGSPTSYPLSLGRDETRRLRRGRARDAGPGRPVPDGQDAGAAGATW